MVAKSKGTLMVSYLIFPLLKSEPTCYGWSRSWTFGSTTAPYNIRGAFKTLLFWLLFSIHIFWLFNNNEQWKFTAHFKKTSNVFLFWLRITVFYHSGGSFPELVFVTFGLTRCARQRRASCVRQPSTTRTSGWTRRPWRPPPTPPPAVAQTSASQVRGGGAWLSLLEQPSRVRIRDLIHFLTSSFFR